MRPEIVTLYLAMTKPVIQWEMNFVNIFYSTRTCSFWWLEPIKHTRIQLCYTKKASILERQLLGCGPLSTIQFHIVQDFVEF